MMHTLLGPEGFRRGMDLYIERHDGSAATTDDFVSAMQDGGGIDLGQFRRWYSQAGTPVLASRGRLRPGGAHVEPAGAAGASRDRGRIAEGAHAPAARGGPRRPGTGRVLRKEPSPRRGPFDAEDGTVVLDVREPDELFVLRGIEAPPGRVGAARVLRPGQDRDGALGTRTSSPSSPTIPDPFARWDAGQTLALSRLDRLIEVGGLPQAGTEAADPAFVEAMRAVLCDRSVDGEFAAEVLNLPSEGYLADRMERIDVDAIHQARRALRQALGEALAPDLTAVRRQLRTGEPYRFDAQGVGRRALANACLGYLAATEIPSARRACLAQFEAADNMTDTVAALGCLVHIDCEEREEAFAKFEERWLEDSLVMDKWLALQATSSLPGTLDRVVELMSHPAFDGANPNRLRALVHSFCQGNPVHFHAAGGSGYRFWEERMRAIDSRNPEVAARLAGVMAHWRRYDDERRDRMGAAMEAVLASSGISRNTNEVLTRILKPPH